MKGLLIKDWRITLQNGKLVILVLWFGVMMIFLEGADGVNFVVAFATMICGSLVFNTISVDEFDKSIVFLMTMPIDKGIYVAEKYVFAIGNSLIGCIVSSVFCMIFIRVSAVEVVYSAAAIFAGLSLFLIFSLPIQLKFGGEMGRIVLIGVIACFAGVRMLLNKIGDGRAAEQLMGFYSQGVTWLNSCSRLEIAVIVAFIWIGCLWCSIMISKSIMKNKEF